MFQKSGFIISNSDNNSFSDIEEDLNEDNNLWQELGQNLDLGNTSIEEFYNCDESLITSELCIC